MKMGKNMQRNKKWAQRIQKKCGEFLCFFLLLFGSEWCADSDQKMYITCRHDNCMQRCLGCCLDGARMVATEWCYFKRAVSRRMFNLFLYLT